MTGGDDRQLWRAPVQAQTPWDPGDSQVEGGCVEGRGVSLNNVNSEMEPELYRRMGRGVSETSGLDHVSYVMCGLEEAGWYRCWRCCKGRCSINSANNPSHSGAALHPLDWWSSGLPLTVGQWRQWGDSGAVGGQWGSGGRGGKRGLS